MKKGFAQEQIIGLVRKAEPVLAVVDDTTHEALAIIAERSMGGQHLFPNPWQLALTRALPKTIRTDNCKAFCSRAMLTWAYDKGVRLFLIEPSKLNQNAYIEPFNDRFRDECLHENWFKNLQHADVIV